MLAVIDEAGVAGPALLGARLLLAGVFLAAGLSKLRAPDALADAVGRYRLLPARLVPLVARGLPPLEAGAGALLLAGALSRPAAALAAALLVAFAGAMAVNLWQGRRFACGCAGTDGREDISWRLVARNGGLALAAAAVAVWPPAGFGPPLPPPLGDAGPPAVAPVDAWGVLVLLLGLVVLARLTTAAARLRRARQAVAVALAAAPSLPPLGPVSRGELDGHEPGDGSAVSGVNGAVPRANRGVRPA